MGNSISSEREEIRILKLKNLILRDNLAHLIEDLANANRRINDLESWRDEIRGRAREWSERLRRLNISDDLERLRERTRELERLREIINEQFETRRNERRDEFSTLIEGELLHCDICLEEERMTNYQKCNLCYNTWCLSCHSRLNNCPFCRN